MLVVLFECVAKLRGMWQVACNTLQCILLKHVGLSLREKTKKEQESFFTGVR